MSFVFITRALGYEVEYTIHRGVMLIDGHYSLVHGTYESLSLFAEMTGIGERALGSILSLQSMRLPTVSDDAREHRPRVAPERRAELYRLLASLAFESKGTAHKWVIHLIDMCADTFSAMMLASIREDQSLVLKAVAKKMMHFSIAESSDAESSGWTEVVIETLTAGTEVCNAFTLSLYSVLDVIAATLQRSLSFRGLFYYYRPPAPRNGMRRVGLVTEIYPTEAMKNPGADFADALIDATAEIMTPSPDGRSLRFDFPLEMRGALNLDARFYRMFPHAMRDAVEALCSNGVHLSVTFAKNSPCIIAFLNRLSQLSDPRA